jgi:hypothetical protein
MNRNTSTRPSTGCSTEPLPCHEPRTSAPGHPQYSQQHFRAAAEQRGYGINIALSYVLLPQMRLPALINTDALQHFFRINRDIFLHTLALTFAFGFF